jgi:hypothetical protein
MPILASLGAGAVGAYRMFRGDAAAIPVYVEDVFSTFLYNGDGVAGRLIQNNIDLAGKGGLVWTKSRSSASWSNIVIDTNRGTDIYGYKRLFTNGASGEVGSNFGLTAFNSNGYTIGGFDSGTGYNSPDFNNTPGGFGDSSPTTYVSWTWRKQPKFFDVVTYTGDGTSVRSISHNLGSTPGFIIIKATSTTGDWSCYHRSLGVAGGYISLNSTAAASGTAFATPINSTVFSIENSSPSSMNTNGVTYVAYLFAHDAGGFGLTGTDNVITCGSFTYSSGTTVNLGYEPQWILIKRTDSSTVGSWYIIDAMRIWSTDSDGNWLLANSNGAETSGTFGVAPTSTGFRVVTGYGTNSPYIYIAIRRGPMKIPTSGTSVFKPVRRTGNGSSTIISAGFPIDASFTDTSAGTYLLLDRLRSGTNYFRTISTNAEAAGGAGYDTQDGYRVGTGGTFPFNTSSTSYSDHFFRRAPGFFDVVSWTGTGTTRNISHNLGVKAELVIRKVRNGTADGASDWLVGFNFAPDGSSSGNIYLQSSNGAQNPSGSVFFCPMTSTTFGTDSSFNNQSGKEYVAYLFATCPGVSKVGSYTGNGSSQTIDCGFSAGARYVLIKRTDSTGDWTIFDSALGIVGDNEVFGRFNSPGGVDSSAVADHIDPTSVGFIVNQVASSNINVNNATYLFLAIA